jgi:hypothetical protein
MAHLSSHPPIILKGFCYRRDSDRQKKAAAGGKESRHADASKEGRGRDRLDGCLKNSERTALIMDGSFEIPSGNQKS